MASTSSSRPRRDHASLEKRSSEEKEEVVIECPIAGCGWKTHKKMRFQAAFEMEAHRTQYHVLSDSVSDGRDDSKAEELSEPGKRLLESDDDSRRAGFGRSLLLEKGFGASGHEYRNREKCYFDTYGAENFLGVMGAAYIPEVPVAKQKPKPAAACGEVPAATRAPPGRMAKGPKASTDGVTITKICKFCGVHSYPAAEEVAERWILDHQASSDACLQVQKGGEIKIDRKKRFLQPICFVFNLF